MEKNLLFVLVATFLLASHASWYWPFGSDEKDPPRISSLMAPATALIDEASDLAADGKVTEAVEKYRVALVELDRVESENPDRVDSPEFGTLKTKRAYIGAAIDSLLLNQARDNAKTVAVSDTTELERKLAEERSGRKVEGKEQGANVGQAENEEPHEKQRIAQSKGKPRSKKAKPTPHPLTKAELVMKAITEKDFAAADALIEEMLKEKPNGATALNLKAAKESAEGNLKEAERTLDQAIQSNPRNYYAYYNMARLYLQVNPENTSGARRYYETARVYGCPEDEELEVLLK